MNITTDDLELLAKVAGVEVMTDGGGRCFKCENQKIWSPLKSRDDVALVVKGLSEGQKRLYEDELYELWLDSENFHLDRAHSWAQELPAETSTRLLLEVLK